MKTGDVHSAFIGLNNLDAQIKGISATTRFKIAYNMTLLRAIVETMERVQNKVVSDITTENNGLLLSDQAKAAKLQSDITEAIMQLRSREVEVRYHPIKLEDLKLDENPNITADTLSRLLPILEWGTVDA